MSPFRLSSLLSLCIVGIIVDQSVAGCPPYPAVPNGQVSPQTALSVGQSVTIQCDAGYTGDPGPDDGTDQPTCAANASSTSAPGYYTPGIRCAPISCGAYTPPVDGTVSPTGPILYNQTAAIACDTGFAPSGSGSTAPACHADGSFGLGVGCRRVPLVCLSAVTQSSADTAAANTAPFANRTCDGCPPPVPLPSTPSPPPPQPPPLPPACAPPAVVSPVPLPGRRGRSATGHRDRRDHLP